MSQTIAEMIILVLLAYAALGIIFALPFALVGWRHVLRGESTGTIGFRILLVPGATLLWPWLLLRWSLGGRTSGE